MKEWLKPDFEEDPVVEPKPKSTAAAAAAAIRKEKQLQADAAAALADRQITTEQTTVQMESVESVATISVDNALSSTDTNEIRVIKVETEDVTEAIEQLNVADDTISDSYDDLNDLIEKI